MKFGKRCTLCTKKRVQLARPIIGMQRNFDDTEVTPRMNIGRLGNSISCGTPSTIGLQCSRHHASSAWSGLLVPLERGQGLGSRDT